MNEIEKLTVNGTDHRHSSLSLVIDALRSAGGTREPGKRDRDSCATEIKHSYPGVAVKTQYLDMR